MITYVDVMTFTYVIFKMVLTILRLCAIINTKHNNFLYTNILLSIYFRKSMLLFQ